MTRPMSTMTMMLVTVVACWTLVVCFAVVLCGAAQNGDRADQADPAFAAGSVGEALASLATRP